MVSNPRPKIPAPKMWRRIFGYEDPQVEEDLLKIGILRWDRRRCFLGASKQPAKLHEHRENRKPMGWMSNWITGCCVARMLWDNPRAG